MDPEDGDPLIQLKDVSSTEPNDSKARQFLRHGTRSMILGSQGKNPIAEMEKAVECTPIDCAAARSNLAGYYLQASPPRLAEAAELYRQAYPYMSDTIHVVEEYEDLLNELENYKEADRLNERKYELDSIYRRRRGEGR